MAIYSEFEAISINIGQIIHVEDFPEARKPAYKLKIDLGPEIGIKNSSAQITQNYTKEELVNRQIVAVTNFPPKQIGPFVSEVLVLGVNDEKGNVILLEVAKQVKVGSKIY